MTFVREIGTIKSYFKASKIYISFGMIANDDMVNITNFPTNVLETLSSNQNKKNYKAGC
jgi:hypothetical protein